MPVALYMDQHVPRVITEALRPRGVEVLTAFEDDASTLDDPPLLDRASALGRVLFSQDTDLLAEATRRPATGVPFAGVVYAHPLRVTVGDRIRDLELIGKAAEPDDLRQRIIFLPL